MNHLTPSAAPQRSPFAIQELLGLGSQPQQQQESSSEDANTTAEVSMQRPPMFSMAHTLATYPSPRTLFAHHHHHAHRQAGGFGEGGFPGSLASPASRMYPAAAFLPPGLSAATATHGSHSFSSMLGLDDSLRSDSGNPNGKAQLLS